MLSDAFRRLASNLGSFILALLLGVVVWIAATLQSDPFAVGEFPNVSISLVNQPDDTILFEPFSDRVAVTARAPQSELAKLNSSDFQATMDLSTIQPGMPASVPIEVTTDNEAVQIEVWSPLEQTIHLEAVGTITLPVAIDIREQVATGYQATSLEITPEQVSVHGPETLLTDVASVSGSISVEGARDDVVEEVRVRPLDADGELVPGLQWNPDSVRVQVGVRRRLGFKPEVEVVPDLRGEPSPGYRQGGVLVEPSTVTLAGVPSILEELPGFVETWPISVTGATLDLVVRSPLNVPNNVVVVGVDYVTVTIEVLPIQGSRAMTDTVEIRGVRPGWTASPSPNVVDVLLEGPDAILAEMTSDDLQVILDLFDYDLGVHRIEPEVLAPEGVTVVSIFPETIEVVIQLVPTPTPTVPMTPTLTITPTLTTGP